MKAVAATSPGKVEIVDIPMPRVAEYECLVRNRACGLCNGTDLKIIDDEVQDRRVPFPVLLGHEGVGEVVEVGAKVRTYKVGDRVLNPGGRIEPGTPFTSMWANMKEYSVVQDHVAMQEMGMRGRGPGATRLIPREISFEDGGVILVLKECWSAVRNFGCRPGAEALIYGDGPAAQALARFLKLEGAAFVACVGHRPDRLKRILERGQADMVVNAHTESLDDCLKDRRFDLAIDAVGSPAVIRESARRLKPGGKVGVFGVIHKKDCSLSLLDLPNHVSVHMLNWPYQEHSTHDELVRAILDGRIDPKDYYSHVMPLDDAARAVEMVRSREAYKVVLKI
ncbi:MAG: alcohol dehydrogenase catalytic domain-containing protein [Candidatus Sumerlaeota bacterium]|nr:alcohol dehydrogenase catalytic domain-containing protein [Candidatus Sumerlaeota bacterium]